MIPSVLAHQLRQGVEDFLRTTFPVSTPAMGDPVRRLLDEDGGVFKGPYLSIDLPFLPGQAAESPFPDIPLPFHPHLHQEKAFERIRGPRPRSTIVATGTGSGKTECFLLPILDHGLRHSGEPGIKAVIVYPMNALANDQAKRLAMMIWGNDRLRGRVTAGLYVGSRDAEPVRAMGPDMVVTDRDTMRTRPPDILLTNYKMLDYLLVRPDDATLWRENGPETLRYLVTDELHTFDGAQGTDLACLVRRLKARLGTPAEHLCCVGTSATLGSDAEKTELIDYARKVFGEPFDDDAVIGEYRRSAADFLARSMVSNVRVPGERDAAALRPEAYEGVGEYLRGQVRAWFPGAEPFSAPESPASERTPLRGGMPEASQAPPSTQTPGRSSGGASLSRDHVGTWNVTHVASPPLRRPVRLSPRQTADEEASQAPPSTGDPIPGGASLRALPLALPDLLLGHVFFQNLLKALDGRTRSYEEVLGELEKVTPELRGADPDYRANLLTSLLALVSAARRVSDGAEEASQAPPSTGDPTSYGAEPFRAPESPASEKTPLRGGMPEASQAPPSNGDPIPGGASLRARPTEGGPMSEGAEEASQAPPSNGDPAAGGASLRALSAPFLHVRIQMWLRELRRMVAEIREQPRLRFADDLNDEQRKLHLPAIHCRECGALGWAGWKRRSENTVHTDLREFYARFFNDDPNVAFLFPEEDGGESEGAGDLLSLCRRCLTLSSRKDRCASCGAEDPIRVLVPENIGRRRERIIGRHDCPYCGAFESLTILGSRAASLTSVLIAQLFASEYNDDRKLLTFSDSVQDAAHRAGFFGARTYRFNLRTAIQQLVMSGAEGSTLAELPGRFETFWKGRFDEETYLSTFLAPNMEWMEEVQTLRQRGRLEPGAQLPDEVGRRLSWEIFAEYGFNARIGRTLEKTSASIAVLDPGLFDRAVGDVAETLRNEIGELRGIGAEHVRRLVAGIVARLRTSGAVFHPALDPYIERFGDTFLLNRIPWMPNFGQKSRTPQFLTTRYATRFHQIQSGGSGGTRTWFETWAERCLGDVHALAGALCDRVYDHALARLERLDVLERREVRGDRVWGLRPEALRITRDVAQFRCDRCGHQTSAGGGERTVWDGAPCLRFRCGGRYAEATAPDQDYYRKLYEEGDVQRVFPEEHTGLLERDEREVLEREFKASGADRRAWYPNLLSCTPTLELGIDVGDLSTVVLCSVPPTNANYLQRIGRAGRRDGNALTTTVANGRPHDLFFFEQPEEMIAGRVEPPGVFLNASAVLERQFTGFCFDRWVASGIRPAALPMRLGRVLDALEPADETKFPHNLLRFIETEQAVLFDAFTALFAGELQRESVEQIRRFVEGDGDQQGSLRYRILSGLEQVRKERDSLRGKIRALQDKIRRLANDPARDRNTAQTLAELNREKAALQALVRDQISGRNTLNFFSDEGLLPNYAFPEAGVVLRSVIYRRRARPGSDGSGYDTWVYRYERPAATAIEELAPENEFYAGGRKVRVDQVDMTVSEVEEWRFCDQCCHAELVARGDEHAACPRCGSVMWSDAGQKRRMLKMRQVFATTADKESRIGDDSDDREPVFYVREMLTDVDPRHVRDAWRIESEDLPFGFEFVERATFREVNFGVQAEDGDNVRIAGKEATRTGFAVCRHCGRMQDRRREKVKHALSCPARDRESEENLLECVYLYREFDSEAIRILLPMTSFEESDRILHSFVAALNLGLKLKFGGSIDHLRTTMMEEPVPDADYRKRYLVVYDTVPGGTGYLKELTRSEQPLLEVLRLALDRMRSCACARDPDKDGCYRCLFAYRHSYRMEETSRGAAVDLLSAILAGSERMVRIPTLGAVDVSPLFDSELERRFVGALRNAGTAESPVNLTKEVVQHKTGYALKIGDRVWRMELQAQLGPEQGVGLPSRADFVFHPGREGEGLKPIVVFTDGFRIHWKQIGRDMAQRMAIARSGRYWVWSLTYRDVENRYRNQSEYYRNFLEPGDAPGRDRFGPFLDGYGLGGARLRHRQDSFAWLLELLRNPDEAGWARYAFVHGLVRLEPDRYGRDAPPEDWKVRVADACGTDIAAAMAANIERGLYGAAAYAGDRPEPTVEVFAAVDQDGVQSARGDAMRIAALLRDDDAAREQRGFEREWNGFLRMFNLFQFLPNAWFVTSEGLTRNAYDALRFGEEAAPPEIPGEPTAPAEKAADWDEAAALAVPEAGPILDAAREAGWPPPEAGYELQAADGEIVAEAELAWPDRKVAVLREDQADNRAAFETAGWRVANLAAALDDPAALFRTESAES